MVGKMGYADQKFSNYTKPVLKLNQINTGGNKQKTSWIWFLGGGPLEPFLNNTEKLFWTASLYKISKSAMHPDMSIKPALPLFLEGATNNWAIMITIASVQI